MPGVIASPHTRCIGMAETNTSAYAGAAIPANTRAVMIAVRSMGRPATSGYATEAVQLDLRLDKADRRGASRLRLDGPEEAFSWRSSTRRRHGKWRALDWR